MDTTGQTSNQTSGSRDQLISDLKLVIKDAEELLRNTGQQMGSGYELARARFESTLQNARTGLTTVEQRVVAGTKDAMESTDRYVQANPWQAVGIGAVAGLVVGILLSRK